MLHSSIIRGEIDPSRIKRVIAYRSVLKPGANIVALYKLVAEFNKETYVQMDYCVETIHWHSVFDSILLYTFNPLNANVSNANLLPSANIVFIKEKCWLCKVLKVAINVLLQNVRL